MSVEIPNISGRWNGYSSCVTQQPGENANIWNITKFHKIYTVEQNGLFVSWRSQADNGRPVVLNQLGIWKQKYKRGVVKDWELYITDYDDNQVAMVQIVEKDGNGVPIKLHRTSVESGFSRGDRIQKPEVINTVLEKVVECGRSRPTCNKCK